MSKLKVSIIVVLSLFVSLPAFADYRVSNGSYQGSGSVFLLKEVMSGGSTNIINGTGDGSTFVIVDYGGGNLYQYTTQNNYGFKNVSNDSTLSVAQQTSNPISGAWKPDGSALYILNYRTGIVYQYNTTAFDVSSSTLSDTFDFSTISSISTSYGMAFNSDGTKFFITAYGGNAIFSYNLSTAWNISTSSFVTSLSTAGCTDAPRGLSWNKDGTKFFIIDSGSSNICSYTLSTGFDLSSASYSFQISVGAEDGTPVGISMSYKGDTMFMVGDTNNSVFAYSMSTPFSLNSASYSGNSYDYSTQTTGGKGMFWDKPPQY